MSDYEKFLDLHHRVKPLVIANAWNVKSAQLIEKNGFDAIATSSGAIADSLGYVDGEKIPFAELLYMLERIRSCTGIPLSVDMERGYADNLNDLNTNIQKLIQKYSPADEEDGIKLMTAWPLVGGLDGLIPRV